MSQEDYATVMGTLSGNLTEGGNEKPTSPHVASSNKNHNAQPNVSSAEESRHFVFQLQLDAMIGSLYFGGTHLVFLSIET